MSIILAKVEETVDAAIEGSCQLVGDDVPLVVTVEIEEVALVVRICLRLIEMAVLADVFLHVAVGVDAVVALQFGGEAR